MLTREEILHVATLARIGLNEKDVEKYQQDLSAVLDYFNKLSELSVDGVEPIGHITGMQDVTRADAAREFPEAQKQQILADAPEVKDGQIKVKSVL